MKLCLVILSIFISSAVSAQVGRHEQPVDTIPIGGAVQETKENQMQAQDELLTQLIAVRDSVNALLPGKDARNASIKRQDSESLAAKYKELDDVISGLKNSEHNPELMKRAYTLLTEVRQELKSPTAK